jgi:hypothetical protein
VDNDESKEINSEEKNALNKRERKTDMHIETVEKDLTKS